MRIIDIIDVAMNTVMVIIRCNDNPCSINEEDDLGRRFFRETRIYKLCSAIIITRDRITAIATCDDKIIIITEKLQMHL